MIAFFRQSWNRLVAMLRRDSIEMDLNAEIASHLEAAIEDNLRRGMTLEEAQRQARIGFGGIGQAAEEHREKRGLPTVDTLRQDIRYSLRALGRDRAFTCIVLLILALGVGANVAVFSVVNAMLLRPLSFRDPDQLVWFAGNKGKGGLSDQTYTVAVFEEFRRHNTSFQDITSYQTFYNSIQYKLIGQADPVPVVGIQVAENFFPMLGVQPMLGRQFTSAECRRGGPATALLSHQFWQNQFGGDRSIVGRTVTINASPSDITGPITVVGVLPPSFDFGSVFSPGMRVDFYVPAYMDFWRTWGNTLAVLGRLKPGVSVAQAQAEADILLPQLRLANKNWFSDYLSRLSTLQDHVSGRLRRLLVVLWCAVALILLIVCLNISNLLMARASAREKEFAMRSALGAGRGRLVRQLLTESLLLGSGGAVLGLAFAWAVVSYFARQSHIALPLLSTAKLDGLSLAWTVLIAIFAGVVFGIVPAFKISDANLQQLLNDGGSRMSQSKRHDNLRSTLVVSEVALACVLLIGAGLLLRSFVRLLDVDLGFEPARVAAIKIEVNDGGNLEKRAAMVQEILRQVRSIPGIESAGLTDMLPLDRNRSWGLVAKENVNDRSKEHGAFVYVVSPGYLETMGMRLRAGRDIAWQQDGAKSQHAIIINEAAARREWPGQDPIGRLAYGAGRGEAQVVGVISDVRESALDEQASPQIYIPITQFDPEGIELVVRTRLPIATVEPAILSTLKSLNPGQPRTQFRNIQQIVEHSVSPRRFLLLLVTAFAGFGLLLASLGIYGVISYSVSQRSQEIGIRMALGATSGQVQLSVFSRTLRLTLIGVAIGAAASFIAARAIATLLFGTEPTDPITFTAMSSLLVTVGLLAGHIPARRASRTDPMLVLRGQ